jgi:surfactin synthase thioesterase subunit
MNDTEHLMTIENNQNKGGSAYSMLIPGIRNIADYPQVASLAAPKPALFFNGTRDKLFPVDGVKASYEVMQKAWAEQGAADKLTTKLWDEKHFFNKAQQKEVVEFFERQLIIDN